MKSSSPKNPNQFLKRFKIKKYSMNSINGVVNFSLILIWFCKFWWKKSTKKLKLEESENRREIKTNFWVFPLIFFYLSSKSCGSFKVKFFRWNYLLKFSWIEWMIWLEFSFNFVSKIVKNNELIWASFGLNLDMRLWEIDGDLLSISHLLVVKLFQVIDCVQSNTHFINFPNLILKQVNLFTFGFRVKLIGNTPSTLLMESPKLPRQRYYLMQNGGFGDWEKETFRGLKVFKSIWVGYLIYSNFIL